MTTTREAALEAALLKTRALVCEAAVVGFNYADGDWADRLYRNNGDISAALSTPAIETQGYVDPYRAHGSKQIMPRVSPGLYVAHWASGGSSEVSIGMASSGDNWIAPSNWIAPAMIHELEAKGSWGEIYRLEALAARPAPQPVAEHEYPDPLIAEDRYEDDQPAADTRVVVKPLSFDEIVNIIETTEVSEMTEAGDRRWTRRIAELLQRKQFATPAPSDKIAEAEMEHQLQKIEAQAALLKMGCGGVQSRIDICADRLMECVAALRALA